MALSFSQNARLSRAWPSCGTSSATNSESVIAVWFADVTPSAVHVGNIVQGARMAWAMGRDIGVIDDESDQAKKVC